MNTDTNIADNTDMDTDIPKNRIYAPFIGLNGAIQRFKGLDIEILDLRRLLVLIF